MLMPDGSFQSGSFKRPGRLTKKAAQSAQWKVEPKDIPEGLRDAWLAIEFGSYPEAARCNHEELNGKGPGAWRPIAEQVRAGRPDRQNRGGPEALGYEGDAWEAYKGFSAIPIRYKGYEIPDGREYPDSGTGQERSHQAGTGSSEDADQGRADCDEGANQLKSAVKQLQTLVKLHRRPKPGFRRRSIWTR